ncbi:uncharacterized protein BDR25DRAFT_392560 [Lindgomyces ingoldianus]|uniref:Uncharacterized protein n=1 Tax=Lindgomyces ingoldianus TaxID=673940 RepID=A0ACB6R3K1_9PLEO|nr:uncharacterized protein BDR25DRAFT_392560 [Lindgomyces ingoldianus]KAF2473408.1 hypothetical protein BDR25DRAFT_392560 [Lindgomyces ingoldianus]
MKSASPAATSALSWLHRFKPQYQSLKQRRGSKISLIVCYRCAPFPLPISRAANRVRICLAFGNNNSRTLLLYRHLTAFQPSAPKAASDMPSPLSVRDMVRMRRISLVPLIEGMLDAQNRSPRYSRRRAAGQFVTNIGARAEGQRMQPCIVVVGVASGGRLLCEQPTTQNITAAFNLMEAPRIMCVLIGLSYTPQGPKEQPSARATAENRYCLCCNASELSVCFVTILIDFFSPPSFDLEKHCLRRFIMAGPALQLFPPPPRPPRQPSPNRKLRVKPPTPEPTAEKMESAKSTKAPTDFHELIIQVNSVPVSPSNSVAAPPRAHIPNSSATRSPTQESRPIFDSPPRPREPSPTMHRKASHRIQDPRAPSPSLPVRDDQRKQRSPNSSPVLNRVASPAFSEIRTVHSASPTLVRANSAATNFTRQSTGEEIPIRSIFPVYNPTVPLAQQQYKPTQASPTHIPKTQISRSPYSPEFYIPHSNIAGDGSTSPPPKPFFTPSHLLDNLWVACNGQEDPAVQLYTLRMHRATAANPTITFGTTPSLPFYSLGQANLAGEHEVQSIMQELLIQRHHPTQPRVLPIAHLDLIAPPSMDSQVFDPLQQESTTLLTSIYPKLAALQALDAAANTPAASHIALTDPGATSPAAQALAEGVLMSAAQRECCALAWTRDAPQQQTNPWAQHMPSEGSYSLHHPSLGIFPIQIEGDCSVINKPSTRPMTAIYGHNIPSTPRLNNQKPASITIMNPYILSPTSPRATAFANGLPPPPPRLDSLGLDARPISITPSEMDVTQLPTTTDATADDAMLARLDFANDALILNLGALSRFGNPFLIDVAASTLLAVAVAEAVRGRRSRNASQENFEPPPPSIVLGKKGPSTAKQFKDSFVDGYEAWGGKKHGNPVSSLRKWSIRSTTTGHTSKSESFDKDIELGEWYGQSQTKTKSKEGKQKKKKEEKDEDKLPLVTRTIISVLTFAFKTVVFVLRIAIKIVAGVVVMIIGISSRLPFKTFFVLVIGTVDGAGIAFVKPKALCFTSELSILITKTSLAILKTEE